jgi:hypothetical protein
VATTFVSWCHYFLQSDLNSQVDVAALRVERVTTATRILRDGGWLCDGDEPLDAAPVVGSKKGRKTSVKRKAAKAGA